jgi:hypothetical protein
MASNNLHCTTVHAVMFTMKLSADDAKIYSELDSGLSDDLCTACSRVASWAENWQMRLATNKCIALRITNKTNHEATSVDRYMLGNEHLNWCTEVRDLGVLVNHKLLFNQHIAMQYYSQSSRSRTFNYAYSFCSKDSSVLIKAFATYVRPMLEYC